MDTNKTDRCQACTYTPTLQNQRTPPTQPTEALKSQYKHRDMDIIALHLLQPHLTTPHHHPVAGNNLPAGASHLQAYPVVHPVTHWQSSCEPHPVPLQVTGQGAAARHVKQHIQQQHRATL
jgi:hypothetical protein